MDTNDLDPDILALLQDTEASTTPSVDNSTTPIDPNFPEEDFDFGGDSSSEEGAAKVDLTVTQFKPITKFFNEEGHKVFDDPTYYKTALSGEGDIANRLHATLSKFLKTDNPQDRTVYRQQLYSIYYEFLKNLGPKLAKPRIMKAIPACRCLKNIWFATVWFCRRFLHRNKNSFFLL